MHKKVQLGQFYSTNSQYITDGLLSIFPTDATIVDPFAGQFDLLNILPEGPIVLGYDLDPQNDRTEQRDSLLDPIEYTDKWIFTNPPYLARNKNKDKTIYDFYQTDDLYKAALKSIIGCEGGVIIVPLNFLSSEDDQIRIEFLSQYMIKALNIFEEQVFDDTTYTVCAFSFKKRNIKKQIIKANIFPSKAHVNLRLNLDEGYRIGNEIYTLPQSDIKVFRLREQGVPNSNIFLKAIDSGTEEGKICLQWKDELHYGINTDRAFATIVLSVGLTKIQQHELITRFNEKLSFFRNKYHSLFLTNYRNSTKAMARKRIGFDLVYLLISNVLLEMEVSDVRR